MAAIHTLRVFVAVPQAYSRAARPGSTADAHPRGVPRAVVPGHAGPDRQRDRSRLAHPARRSRRGQSRAARSCPAPTWWSTCKLPQAVASMTIPANTLLFRAEGLRVAVVRDGRAQLVP